MRQAKTKIKGAALATAGAAVLFGIGWASMAGVSGLMALLNI